MLTIVLKILSVLGIMLLALLGIVLILLALVLFFPIRYKLFAERHPLLQTDGGKPDLKIAVKANWLFGLMQVRYVYPDPGAVIVKLLFFKVYDSSREKQTARTPKREKRKRTEPEPKGKEDKREEEEEEEKEKEEILQRTSAEDPRDTARKGKSASARKTEPKKKFEFSKLCDRVRNARENADYYKEILTGEDTRGLLDHVFRRLGKIIKSIRPGNLRARILFGTGSPDTTGYLLGIYGMLSPHLGRHVNVTPDFERAVLEGDCYAAGHITVCRILWNGLKLFFDKRLRKLIKKIKAKDREENGK